MTEEAAAKLADTARDNAASSRGRIARLSPSERKRIAALGAAARWGGAVAAPDPFPGFEPQRAVLLAATRLFAAGGFDRPTLRQVAEAAGVGLQTIYRYYENKRALYLACCANLLDDYMLYFDALVLANDTPATKLYALALGLADTHYRPDLTRLIHRELLEPGSDAVNRAYGTELAPHFALYFAAAEELGAAGSAERVVAMISMIMGAVQFQPVSALLSAVPAVPNDVESIAEMALRTVFHEIDWRAKREQVNFVPFSLDMGPGDAEVDAVSGLA